MKRRDFITALGGAAVAWPLAARAQQGGRMPRIGVLMVSEIDDPDAKARLAGFLQGLEKFGWSDRHNVRIDTRFALPGTQVQVLAKELVDLQPDVILAQATPGTVALQRATSVIPIVFVNVTDPIGSGFVASLARPGGNLTGLLLYEEGITGKWLAMLKEIAPRLTRAALVLNPKTAAYYQFYLRAAEAAAPSVGIELVFSPIENDAAEIERSITSFARVSNGGLIIGPDTPKTPCSALKLSRLPLATTCQRSIRTACSLPMAVSCPTAPTASISFGRPRPMSIASCAAPNPPTFQFRHQLGTKRLSISRLPRRSASKCQTSSSWRPTR